MTSEDEFREFLEFQAFKRRLAEAAPSSIQERTIISLWDEWFPTIPVGSSRWKNRRGMRVYLLVKFQFRGEVISLGDLRVGACTKPVLVAWIAMLNASPARAIGRAGKTLKPGSVDQIRMSVQAMFQHFVSTEELPTNPFKGIRRDKARDRQRQGYYTPEQVEQFAAGLPPVASAILRHAFRTCLRKENVRLLKKSQIDWAGSDLVLTGKGGKTIRICCPTDVLEELRALCASSKSEYVYADPRRAEGKPIPSKTLWQWMKRAREITGLHELAEGEPPNMHHARHGGAIDLLEKGTPITLVKDQLAHGDIKQTARYLAMRGRMRDLLREKVNLPPGARPTDTDPRRR